MAEQNLMHEKFYRLPRKKVIAGICAGFGESFDVNPNLIRALLLIALFSGIFPIGIAYIVLIFVLPKYEGRSSSSELYSYEKAPLKRSAEKKELTLKEVKWKLDRTKQRLNRLESYFVSDRYQLDCQYKTLKSD